MTVYLLSQIHSFFSGTSWTTQKHNRSREPFFFVRAWIINRLYFLLSIVRETSCSSFRYTWPWIGTTRCLRLNKSCWPKILYRKNYGDKSGSKSFQQQRKMFCGKFGWPSMKVLQIKVGGRKLFGRSLKLLANVQCLRQGSEVCNWYQLANSPSLQSRRILPCDRFGLSTDRALGRVKKWFNTIKRLLWGYNSPIWRRRSTNV